MLNDTIAAISTPSGRAGIGVIRVSGQYAIEVAQIVTGKELKDRAPALCNIRDRNNQVLDEVIVILYAAPRSYTGENLIEIQCHGNPIILNEIIALCCARGARPANPGEFTERAFRNGKLSLEKAEAVADLINSQSLRAVRSARRSLSGTFSKKISLILTLLKNSLIQIEASIDFSEVSIGDTTRSLKDNLEKQKLELENLISDAKRGVKLSMGLQVVLAGRPNVGKSSLLNSLSSSNRAIVSEQPGTTRDTVDVSLELNGNVLKIIDTAGIRENADEIEKEGINRTKEAIQLSDLVLLIIDNTDDLNDINETLKSIGLEKYKNKSMIVLNKIDKMKEYNKVLDNKKNIVGVSALTGEGMATLIDMITSYLAPEEEVETEFTARARHIIALECALSELDNISNLTTNSNPELLAEHYKISINFLSQITGDYSTEDLLGDIFSKFCIGK
ncbi:MAG: tRNA uridine-5-carboxymethylaminomethyl(34) synthesis GTPase MnmE [Pseudomonadota bacterium]|nr:tRNA uridine-5-carboxymethylaminomethyl(34) synthesis GTPase MnmE [Pseudomonadota bacterium]